MGRCGVPVGIFAAVTPLLFGINLLLKRSTDNRTNIAENGQISMGA